MGSSSLVYGAYAPQTSASGWTWLQVQMRARLPVLACSMVFVIESTSYFGADRTSDPLQRVVEALFGFDACVHWDLIHLFIRKTGHFVGYGIFSLVCFRSFWMRPQSTEFRLLRQMRAHGYAILVTFIVASSDEFHQSFLPNRNGQFSDVMLDCCGAVALGLVLFVTMQVTEGWRRGRAISGGTPSSAYSSSVSVA